MTVRYVRHKEMEITGELYFQLRKYGFDVGFEVRVPSEVHRSNWMRVDIGVFVEGRLSAVIECKKEGKKLAFGRQRQAYVALKEAGLEVFFVNSEGSISKCVQRLRSLRSGMNLATTRSVLDDEYRATMRDIA